MSQQVDELTNDVQDDDLDRDVLEAFRRQDEALLLLDRLRSEEPYLCGPPGGSDKGIPAERRRHRRWSPPAGVVLELHDGRTWHMLPCCDIGVGGARTDHLPAWANGPTPVRLRIPYCGSVIALADVMWCEENVCRAGIRFEFLDEEERTRWCEGLVEALLAGQAIG
jgi:hypothetical protein